MVFEEKTQVAIVGEINTGKSSLIKRLTGNSEIKISALPDETVASKLYLYKDIILVDTPGLNDINKNITKKVNKELKIYDNVVLILNAVGTVLSKNELNLYKKLKRYKTNILIVINKIDKADSIDSIIRYVRKKTEDDVEIIAISTKTGENIEQIKEVLLKIK